ncbi:tol-pal system-associated acyl-CoA thioesterase [Mergibacter septicus]|uniref:Tol-pal system-associated acyl-CoA thioesterase n=1 Tax=Mergibacter septicus TaxID=221402 RepID=A0A8E3S827_9PAST|nr:tol-pal system-associated acyl-CoA thioesterase [Mergibacter septicus]AWX14776.1 tol-pal system-associated acyl-CoA thioesterase [Mergibacter septicus]QDJ14027.1 tol-pal system-associated acyl-CoA thioesterase [Mergibacter septicus]UTU48525.1 tol-pal system-associated acyl-CoA thioesterase [Mergibacter septicus]WMR95845.1 tol-pal system-associated acyl-CoA thioesterase [Mergibacter septicus]
MTTYSQLPIRIYYEDTDAGGIVYHASYLRFFERARTEFLREKGFSQQNLLNNQQLALVVRKIEIDYLQAAKLDDELCVQTYLTNVKKASVLFEQQLIRDDQIICTAKVKIACVDLNSMKPIVLPCEIKQALL